MSDALARPQQQIESLQRALAQAIERANRAEETKQEWARLARRFIQQSGVKLDHPTRVDQDFANVAQIVLLDREQKDQRIAALERERDALAAALSEAIQRGKEMLGDHTPPGDCYSSGPFPHPVMANVCPSCRFKARLPILEAKKPDNILAAHDAALLKPLVEALRPFAEAYREWQTDWISIGAMSRPPQAHVIAGDFANAALALADLPEGLRETK